MKSTGPGSASMSVKRTRRLAAIAVLSAIAVCLWMARQRPGVSAGSSMSYTPPTAPVDDRSSAGSVASLPITWPLEIGRDPFVWVNEPTSDVVEVSIAPDAIEREAADVLRVKAILFAGESSLANINRRMYRVGDTVAGFTIQRIKHRCLLVEKDGVTVRIRVQTGE